MAHQPDPSARASASVVMVGTFGMRAKGTMSARALPLASELVARGWAVRLVVPPWDSPADAGQTSYVDGVAVEHVALGGGPLAVAWRMVQAARAASGGSRQSLVHCFKPKGYGALAAGALARAGWPLVVDIDDWEGRGGWNDRVAGYSAIMRRVFQWQTESLPRWACAVTVASRTLETFAWGLGVAPARVAYVPNGVSVRRHAAWRQRQAAGACRAAHGLPEAPTLLVYTRFDVVSPARILALLHAIRVVSPAARLLVVGAGPGGEERDLDRLARAAGLADAVTIAGHLSFDELPAWLQSADVGLYPIEDTLINRAKAPVKLLEMLALGLPVVAEGVGETVSYLQGGRVGMVVEPGDDAALAGAAARLLHSTSERDRLGALAQGHVWRAHTWERLADEIEHVYRAVISRSGS